VAVPGSVYLGAVPAPQGVAGARRADVGGNSHAADREVRSGVVIQVQAVLLVQVILLDVGQDVDEPAVPPAGTGDAVAAPEGKFAEGVVVAVTGDGELVEVVAALDAGGGVANLLDGGDEQADEDGDDGDHHQQLDQREGGTALAGTRRRVTHVRD